MTDVLLRQTNDGGDITIENGLLLRSEGLETAAYLSLFGGNEDDAGGSDTSLQWWGNLLDDDEPARQYRSETQNLIESLPAIPVNLRRIEQAALRDLAWMLEAELATSTTAEASIPAKDRVLLEVEIITATGQKIELSFG